MEHGIPIVRLRVGGTFDAPALPDIRRAVDEILAVNPRVLLLDLAGCPHIDAAGIDLLLDVHRRMRRNRGRLTVHAPGSEAQRLLRIARVDQVLDVRAAMAPADAPADAAAGPPGPGHEDGHRSGTRAAVPARTLTIQGGTLL